MSLETASYINDLVPTNPEGTDPKSQGDDHIRLIKQVLKTTFAGFTDDVSINITADNLNKLGGFRGGDPGQDFDAIIPSTRWIGVTGGSTGTFPPTGAAGVGDMIFNIANGNTRIYQLYFRSTLIFARTYNGTAWSTWQGLTGLGVAQAWTNMTAQRAFDTVYTNTTGRPIQICVLAIGTSTTSQTNLSGQVLGTNIMQIPSNDRTSTGATYVAIPCTVQLIIPDGATYAVIAGGTHTLTRWSELR